MCMKQIIAFFIFSIILLSAPFIAYPKENNGDKNSNKKKAEKLFANANIYEAQGEIKKSIEKLKEAINLDKTNTDYIYTLGKVIYKSGEVREYGTAIKAFKHLDSKFQINEKIDRYFYLGMLNYDFLKNLDSSENYFNKFLRLSVSSRNFDNLKKQAYATLNAIKLAKELKKDPKPYSPKELSFKSKSSLLSTISLSIIADGTIKAFVLNKSEQAYYLYDLVDDNLLNPTILPFDLYNNEINGGQVISSDGKRIYFTQCESLPDGLNCDIYYSSNKDGEWSEPIYIEEINSKNAIDCKPFVSYDNKRIFFVSEREGGIGLKDIWVSKIEENGKFSVPVNLGKPVNTSNDENSPFIHIGSNILYFSSKGHIGLGGYDIFYTKYDVASKSFEKPKNIGYPINTKNHEINIGINIDAESTFLTTIRYDKGKKTSFNMFNLYSEARPSAVTYTKGAIFDADTKEPLKARFEVIDPVSLKTIIFSYSDPYDGTFLIPIIPGKDYVVNVSRKDYLFYSNSIRLKDSDINTMKPSIFEVPISKIKKNGKFVLNNLLFDYRSSEIVDESLAELEKLKEFIIEHKNIYVEIIGHTDNLGTEEFNQKLSEARAVSVYNFLIEKGIERHKLTTLGKGSKEPLVSNATEEGQAKNRRTEVKVWKIIEVQE